MVLNSLGRNAKKETEPFQYQCKLLDTPLSRVSSVSKNGDFSGQPIAVFSYSTLKKEGVACLNEISCILNLSSLTRTTFS